MKHFLGVGANFLDPQKYGGWDGRLEGCVKDIYTAATIAKDNNFGNIEVFANEQATGLNVVESLKKLAETAKKGDLVWYHYSGHMGQFDDNGAIQDTEKDGKDEYFCHYDGALRDDTFGSLIGLFKKGVKVFLTLDCCNSQYGSRAVPTPTHSIKAAPRFATKDIALSDIGQLVEPKETFTWNAAVITFAGCQEGKYAYDTLEGGCFTNALARNAQALFLEKDTYAALKARVNKDKFMKWQTSTLNAEGPGGKAFRLLTPFK
jgi:metacaspase-1